MQLDARTYITRGFFTCCPHQPVRMHAYIYARQRITLAGNDTGSSTLPQFFMQVFSSTFFKRIYIDCRVFDAVMYWPALYLVVSISIGYICL